ncbi:MAG: hypothetical protein L0221_14965 [Chloroflexi bacterium]|nr:hypothetical protein [Chloroflexota bacterium]
MPDPLHTYLVECFAPGIDDVAVAAAADRARAAVDELRAQGSEVEYVGALLMAEDEVVFHAFRAPGTDAVLGASRAAGLAFERVVESVGVPPGDAFGRELTEGLVRGLEPVPSGLRPIVDRKDVVT